VRWTPTRWYAGLDVVVIGGGPSLEGFDWRRLVGVPTIGCNDAYQLGEDVCSVCIFGDIGWFNHHVRELIKFRNPVFTNQPTLVANSPPWVLTLPREQSGLHKNALGWGGNTGCAAVNLALILGAKRVVLLGFDMKLKGFKANWHPNHLNKPNPDAYQRFKRGFEAIKKDLPKVFPGSEIVNAGPDSDLNLFPEVDLEEILWPSRNRATEQRSFGLAS